MKRSEMLDLIIKHGISVTGTSSFYDCEGGDKECANIILKVVEEAGMLPPELPNASTKETCNQWGESLSDFHEWEKENE